MDELGGFSFSSGFMMMILRWGCCDDWWNEAVYDSGDKMGVRRKIRRLFMLFI